jgi:class 3 adenylate cyclase/tetratricopeptide (TPR) repeat protein
VITCAQCGRENPAGARFCNSCATALSPDTPLGGEVRKVVSVLFCDVTGSTELGERLDPEALRVVLAGYFEQMRAIVERHGGTVEKFIGDAVMAVFGVPAVHEDDALRAVRAALEMRDALPELGVRGRISVMTGEVVAGTEERLVTGDAVNVAARLEQAAPVGEVLIGEPTLALVRDAVVVEPMEPLSLRGKAEFVLAYRLLGVRDAPERRHDAPFVGRDCELALIRGAWDRVRSEKRCELVTVVGDAGVGKSRLAAEALAPIDATIVRGRCLPYGEGITYWPVVEVLKRLGVLPSEEAASLAIGSLLGETETPASAEEMAWAFRKTLELAAAEGPLVVVFDDIQWGEGTFLDLIEHVALLSSGASILLFCMARPELTERRAAWPVAIRLEPLGDEDVDALISDRASGELRYRIAAAAAGNPLFVEEMLAMAGGAEGEVVVPPTLRALLAARLDQLEPEERAVLEWGAIEGEVFHRGAVQALAPADTEVTPRLVALVRKELIGPDRPLVAGEDGFRFRHLLLRDAAYDALPKATRGELHARFAAWFEERGSGVVEVDEVIGYHLEQACRYRTELGMPRDQDMAVAARRRLTAAGRRAQRRADFRAAVSLLGRAAALASPGELELALETDLIDVLFWAGEGDAALRRAVSIAERASTAGDQVGELYGRIQAGIVRMSLEPEGAAASLAVLVEEAQPVLQAAGHDLALYAANYALGQVAFEHARADAALEAYELAAIHARRAGLQQDFLDWRALCRFYGTTPVDEVLEWLDAHEPQAGWDHWGLRACRAHSLSMTGDLDGARAVLVEARSELADRGAGLGLAVMTGIESVTLERLAGDPTTAAELGFEGCRQLDELGDKSFQSTAAAELAGALYELGRLSEADAWVGRAVELGASEDAFTQIVWRQVKAKLLARAGDLTEGERLAREAVAISEDTDFLNGQADANADLAEVLELADRPVDAAIALEHAVALYEQKGNNVSAQRTRAAVTALQSNLAHGPKPTT